MVAGFNISKECVASVGLELLNPQERTRLAHGEARKQNRARQTRTPKCFCPRSFLSRHPAPRVAVDAAVPRRRPAVINRSFLAAMINRTHSAAGHRRALVSGRERACGHIMSALIFCVCVCVCLPCDNEPLSFRGWPTMSAYKCKRILTLSLARTHAHKFVNTE